MKKDLLKILVDEQQIDAITSKLAAQIEKDYKDSKRELVAVCILKGSLMFTADLIRKINIPVSLEFMKVSSYGAGTVSSGKINIQLDMRRDDYENIDILVIEDIIDSGRTLSSLVKHFKEVGATNVKTCTLLDKPERREVDFTPEYVGSVIPDEFVVGYGLDYNEKYRNLPYIGILDPKIYT
jgi:hypoxanthine phosphoribosyltransferase